MFVSTIKWILILCLWWVASAPTPRDLLSVDIYEEQPVGSKVIDIAHELGLSTERSAAAVAADAAASQQVASDFKIVVANPVINDYFGVSLTGGRVSLRKHIDRDMMCQKHKLCCAEGEPISLPDRSVFRRTANDCRLTFRVVYNLKQNGTSKVAFCTIEVNIQDLNDCAPKFLVKESFSNFASQYRSNSKLTSVIIPENAEPDTCFELPMAFDEDSTQFSVQDYHIENSGKEGQTVSGSVRDVFAIRLGGCALYANSDYTVGDKVDVSSLKPYLQLRQRLDRETVSEYNFNLVAIDGAGSNGPFNNQQSRLPHSASLAISVVVGDFNDHAPEVEPTLNFKLKEDVAVGTRVTQIVARDKDIGDNAKIRYEIRPIGASSKPVRFPFGIDSNTGIISIISPLDADGLPPESQGIMEFLVISSDGGHGVSFSSTTTVRAHIEDVNDEAPVIKTVDLASQSNLPRPVVKENLPAGTLVAFVAVSDGDSGVNGMVSCRLDNHNFALESMGERVVAGGEKELQLVTKTPLDREQASVQPVTIICVDHAQPPAQAKTAMQKILISVSDENDNDPVFPSDVLEISLHENNPPGELLLRPNATDADEMDYYGWGGVASPLGHRVPLVYEMDPIGQAFFRLDPHSGGIYTKETFDREKQELIEFGLTARDHGSPQRSATTKVVVRVLDTNDHAPEFEQKEYNVTVPESIGVGEVILQVVAHDRDTGPNAEFIYQLEDIRGTAQKRFSLDPESGNLTTRTELDRETEPHFNFQIYAVDRGIPRQTSICRVNIQVLDINDNAPKFVYPTQANHTIHFSAWNTPGSPLVKLTAMDKDEGVNGEKIFLIADGNEKGVFQLDLQCGDLSLKPGIDPLKVAGRYNLKIEVRDNGSPSLSGYTYITVILDVARNTPATPIQLPHQSQQQNQNEKQPVSRLPYQKPPGGIVARDNVQPLTDPRRSGTSTDQHWPEEEESFFGSEHTLILIICLSAIATMLVFILFMMLAWLRRRGGASNHRHRSRLDVTGPGGLGCGVAGGGGATKRVFLEGSGGGTLLAPPTHVWAEEPVAKEETSGGLNKRMSPVYWLKTPTTVNNIHLQTVNSLGDIRSGGSSAEFTDESLSPAMFCEAPQQANNCLYATAPGGKLIYNTRGGTNAAMMALSGTSSGDTYLSIPSAGLASSGGQTTKYIVDVPMNSVYQSLIRPRDHLPYTTGAMPSASSASVYRTLCGSLPPSQPPPITNKSPPILTIGHAQLPQHKKHNHQQQQQQQQRDIIEGVEPSFCLLGADATVEAGGGKKTVEFAQQQDHGNEQERFLMASDNEETGRRTPRLQQISATTATTTTHGDAGSVCGSSQFLASSFV